MPKTTFFRLPDDKRERILRCAIDEFHRKGFEKANIGEIAARAGVAKGSMYQYFDNKRELFLYTARWTLEFFMTRIDRQTPLAEMDIFDYFLAGTRQRFELARGEKELTLFSQDILSGKFGALTEQANAQFERVSDDYLPRLIEAGKQKGTVRTDISTKTLALFLLGATQKAQEQLFSVALRQDFELTDAQFQVNEALLRDIVTLLKQGMGRA